ncbi:hypothetical protein HK096_011094 [Nowakowskiella sp. JEL0078]|nr:hypothetical protein HK096_011094 [Nowakowskiella sp. JEL0078]
MASQEPTHTIFLMDRDTPSSGDTDVKPVALEGEFPVFFRVVNVFGNVLPQFKDKKSESTQSVQDTNLAHLNNPKIYEEYLSNNDELFKAVREGNLEKIKELDKDIRDPTFRKNFSEEEMSNLQRELKRTGCYLHRRGAHGGDNYYF